MITKCQWDAKDCANVPPYGERYCPAHRKLMMNRLVAVGYLTRWSALCHHAGETRGPEARENIRDTKYGIDR